MKAVALLSLAAVASAAQLPLWAQNSALVPDNDAYEFQIDAQATFAGLGVDRTPSTKGVNWSKDFVKQPKKTYSDIVDGEERFFGTFSVGDAGSADLTYEIVQHDAFPDYRLRLRRPSLCDPDVVQYSGYLDISDEKHLFFWYVRREARCMRVGWCIQGYELLGSSKVVPTRPIPR